MDEKFRKEIVSCVEKVMQQECFSEMKINLIGTSREAQGLMADLIFAVVDGTDKDNKHKKINVAVKIGRRSKELRENLPVVIDCYKRELFFYETVLPAFRQFQLDKNIVNIFEAYPKCYGTVLSEDLEVLVLEDLKNEGFTLHDKQSTMNLQHLQIVLKSYAKFHALTFAFRDQQKDEFKKLTAEYKTVYKKMLPTWFTLKSDPKVLNVLREAGRDDLAAKYVEATKSDELTTILDILDDVPQESVILHQDSHNNNFLFKYKGNDKENPLRVAIIDWQMSGIHSPVLDVSFFLYSTASGKELSKTDKLLKFYHSHLTDFMKELGSDAQKVFPYSTLIEHWRKFAILGLVIAKGVLQMFYIPEDHAPVITGKKESDLNVWNNIKLEKEDVYKERLISCIEQYSNFMLTQTK